MVLLIPEGYLIRKAKEEDIDGVIYINSVTLPEHYTTSFYNSILLSNPDTFLVAEHEGRIIGYHMGRIEYGLALRGFPKFVKKGHVISIAVLKEHRRKGVATMLLKTALEEFTKKGCEVSFLEVRVSNEPAINLYKKMGYEIVDRITGYYSDGEDAFVMEKNLETNLI